MALISCVRCGKAYSDTLSGCPHCKYVPGMFVCQECGAVYGKADAACSTCGIALDHLHDIPAGEAAVRAELDRVTVQLGEAATAEELSAVYNKLQLIGTFMDTADLQAVCKDMLDKMQAAEKNSVDYAKAMELMANAGGIADLANAANLLERLGDYMDAPAKLEECCVALNKARYAQAEANMAAAHDIDTWQTARIMFTGLGNYQDAAVKAAYCDQQIVALHSASKKKKAATGIIISVVAAVAVICVLLFTLIIPSSNYSKGEKLYAQEEFSAAVEAFAAAGNFKDAKAQAEDAQYMALRKQNYLEGIAAMENKDYATATDKFLAAGDFHDAAAKLGEVAYALGEERVAAGDYYGAAIAYINAGGYQDSADKAFSCGLNLLQQGAYSAAVEVYSLLGNSEYAQYASGMVLLTAGDYLSAIETFGAVTHIEDGAYRLTEANFFQGMVIVDSGNFVDAKPYFQAAGEYEGAANMAASCDLMVAEEFWAKGYLNTAKAIYEELPEDLEYNGVSVEHRLAQLKKFKKFVKLCGKWKASGECKAYVRQTHYSTGLWDAWTTTWDDPYDYLVITCVINEDGTVTMSGYAEYMRHTTYSSLSAYLKPTSDTAYFTWTGKKFPSSVKCSDREKLTIDGTKVNLKYSYTDRSESVNFKYKYTSTWKYRDLVEAY